MTDRRRCRRSARVATVDGVDTSGIDDAARVAAQKTALRDRLLTTRRRRSLLEVREAAEDRA